MRGLERLGYVVRLKRRDPKGRLHTEIRVHDEPQMTKPKLTVIPGVRVVLFEKCCAPSGVAACSVLYVLLRDTVTILTSTHGLVSELPASSGSEVLV